MDQRRAKKAAILLLGALALAVLAGGCGSDTDRRWPARGQILSAATPTAGVSTCAACHYQQTANWLASRHANLDPAGNLYSVGTPTIGQVSAASCKSCHDPLGDSNNLSAGNVGNVVRPVVGCESCHGPGSLHANAGGAGPILLNARVNGTVITGATLTLSGQFVMCTSCHELLDMTTGAIKSGPTHSTGLPVPTGSQYVITDSHLAQAGTWSNVDGSLVSASIGGYAMDFSNEKVCAACHDPHGTADINREWARSGHAGYGEWFEKNPWNDYNWSCDGSNTAGCGARAGVPSSRKTCQRCHTTTGFVLFADALRSGDTALAAIITAGSYTIPDFYKAAFKPEMLECKGCHTDNRGTIRNPGAFNASYGGTIRRQYPDMAGSNVCVPCHAGRKAGDYINSLTTKFKAGMTLRDVEAHYLAAAGTMAAAVGYEYAGRSYANPSSYKHDKIGTSSLGIGGKDGPCVGCHMYRSDAGANHTFSAVATSATGTVTGITSDVCFNMNCHAGSNGALTIATEDEKVRFHSALEALEAQLPAKGFTLSTGTAQIWDATDDTGNTTGKNNIGAAFNYLLLEDDPGSYVHNSKYAKRLIYDSLDWLDDNNLNYSVGESLQILLISAEAKAAAQEYLLPNGPLWTGVYPDGYGISSERP